MVQFKEQETQEYKLQDDQYIFPYHYIPYFDKGVGKNMRIYPNGYEYLCYTKHVEEIIKSLSPKSILEVGCGDGKIIGALNGIPERLGVDLSEKAISFARAFNPQVEFQVRDIGEIDRKFDIVFAVEVFEHIPDSQIDYFMNSIFNRINKKGYLVISVPTKVKPLIKKHFRHYDLELFMEHLEKSKVNLKIEKVEHIYKKSKIMKIYKLLTNNNYWFFELKILQSVMWSYVWHKLRFGSEKDGLHLVITLQKK